MSNTVICRFIPYSGKNSSGTNQTNSVLILEINPASGETRRLNISKSQDLKLNFGDSIKCVSGVAAVMINPGTPAGTFLLDPKTRPELQLNAETTKIVLRGTISVAGDIGSITVNKGAATTR